MSRAKLDRTDIRILAHLQHNGRVTNIELASAVALSPSPCLVRVKRLEKEGFITGYYAHINLVKLGETTTIFTEVTLDDHHKSNFVKFEEKIAKVDALMECHLVSGGYDYLLKFVTRGVSHYQEVMESILDNDFGVEKYFSYIVIKTPVARNSYQLDTLFNSLGQ